MARPSNISLCMLVKNEEQLLGELLDYVSPWVREVIIVDTGSTDATVKVARSHGAAILHADVEEAAMQPWILILDPDEWPTMEMLSFIQWFTHDSCSEEIDAVYFTRENRIDGVLLNDDRAYEPTFRLMREYMRYEGWLSEQMFTENSCMAPGNCLLLHHKTSKRQAKQDAFYKDYAERHALELA